MPHWGYVIEGSVTVGYTDGSEEEFTVGEVVYLRPGHDQLRSEGGCLIAEVSPADKMQANHGGDGSHGPTAALDVIPPRAAHRV